MEERRRFPALLAATKSYELLTKNFVSLLRPSGSWVALCACLILAANQFDRAFPSSPQSAFVISRMLIGLGILGVGITGVAHTWYRGVLLGDKPNGPGDLATPPFWRHVGCASVLFLCLAAFVALIGALDMALASDGALAWAAILLISLAGLMLVTRLSLVLPAAAVAERRLTFWMSWMMTSGNTWRLLSGGLLVVVPAFSASIILIDFVDRLTLAWWDTYMLVRPVILVTSLCVVSALGATYLALCYRFFVLRRYRLEDGDSLDQLRDAFS